MSRGVCQKDRRLRICRLCYLKCLGTFFSSAYTDGVILGNPASRVKALVSEKKAAADRRCAFTPEEIQKLLAMADPEWRWMIKLTLIMGVSVSAISHQSAGQTFCPTGRAGQPGFPNRQDESRNAAACTDGICGGHDSLESSMVYTQLEMQQERQAQIELFKLFE